MSNKIIDVYPTDSFETCSALWQVRNTYQRCITWTGCGKWVKRYDNPPLNPISRTKAFDALRAMSYVLNCVDPKPSEPEPPLHITHAVMTKNPNSVDQVIILGTEEGCHDYLKNSLAGFQAVCYIRPVTFATRQ